jgi:MFS family permease
MMLCGLLTASGTLGMAYAQKLSMLFIFSIIFGIGYGTLWPVYAASARDLFPKNYSGSIIGLWTLFHGLGSIISPVLSGWVIDATGTHVWAFILATSCSFLSLLLLLPISHFRRVTGICLTPV